MNVVANIEFAQDEHGWSETYYRQEGGDLGTALDALKTLAAARATLLNNRAIITEVKVSNLDIMRDSLVDAVPQTHSKNVDASLPENPYVAVLVRMEATSLYRRSLYLRGIIKGLTKTPGEPVNLTGTWGANFRKFAGLLKQPDSGWVVRSRLRGTAVPTFPVTVVQAAPGPALRTRILGAAFPFLVGNAVKLSGFNTFNGGNPDWNGTWNVFNAAADHFDIPIKFEAGLPYTGGAKVRLYTYGFNQVTNVIAKQLVRHKVGLIFGAGRGRVKSAKK